MSLAKHIDIDKIVEKLRGSHHSAITLSTGASHFPYASRFATQIVSKYSIPDDGTAEEAAYQFIHDEMELDGKPNLNLASFVSTYMSPMAIKLMSENMSKNLADADEYPALMNIHSRCVSMLAELWHGIPGKAIGSACTGSSEAIHLGGLAMKRRWQHRREAEGKDKSKPNIVMGANAQVALEKFARYFEVEARIVPVSKESQWRLDTSLIRENIDENTIGVFVIMGSTYTGHYEPVAEVAKILDEYEKETGIDIPIHVDGASGAFVAPFCHPSLAWDFKIPRVKSINTSGHKFGLTYAGLGWIIWRDADQLPKDLVFTLHYLGGSEESYNLNFSRPGAQVVAQYFNFLNLGKEGYRRAHSQSLENARFLSKGLEATGMFECVSAIHRERGILYMSDDPMHGTGDEETEWFNPGLPVVAFCLSSVFKKENPEVRQQSISALLRARQWIIPNYPLPPNEENKEILRVVVRESMSADLIAMLLGDIVSVTESLACAGSEDMNTFSLQGDHQSLERRVGKTDQHKGTHAEIFDINRIKGLFRRTAC